MCFHASTPQSLPLNPQNEGRMIRASFAAAASLAIAVSSQAQNPAPTPPPATPTPAAQPVQPAPAKTSPTRVAPKIWRVPDLDAIGDKLDAVRDMQLDLDMAMPPAKVFDLGGDVDFDFDLAP